MQIKSQKITANLALNNLAVNEVSTDDLKVSTGINHVFICDVSGSMYSALGKMRQQLKNRIPNVVGEEDTISIIWFSGRGQAGILKEGVKVKNLLDLQALNTAIDRFLVPICLTAFLDPLILLEQVITNLSSNGKDFASSFLSDGYNNDSSWPAIIAQLEKLDGKLASATFIEYGYYADSAALTEMAETVGGEKIFAKDFDSYQESFEKIMKKQAASKVVVDISQVKDRLTYQFLFAVNQDESITVYSCKGKDKQDILVPANIHELYFYTAGKPKESTETVFSNEVILISAYLLADRLKYKHVEDILMKLGDIKLINQFSGAYGKQKLNELKDSIKEVAFGHEQIFSEGQQEGFKINPKQYCVMDMINDLASGDNVFFPFHEAFNYNRTSAKRTTKIQLNEEEQIALAKAKSLKDVESITKNLEAPEFIYPDNAPYVGMSFDTLVWNSERANLSVQTTLFGKVKLPKNEFQLDEVDSRIHRNYTLIKDGVLNVTEIPVTLDNATFVKLSTIPNIQISLIERLVDQKDWISVPSESFTTTELAHLFESGYDSRMVVLLKFAKLPIINRSMTLNISGKKLAQLEFDLIQVQLAHKYLKNLKEKYDPKTNSESAEKYSVEAAEWLKSIGVTDYNGFSPKTETEKTGDFYVAPVLETKIEKTSSSPTVKSVLEKIELLVKAQTDAKIKAKPLNLMEELMKAEIDELNPEIFTENTANIESLNELTTDYNIKRRQLLFEISKIKFGVILSRTWFTEFENMDQNELDLTLKGAPQELKVKFEFKDSEIAL